MRHKASVPFRILNGIVMTVVVFLTLFPLLYLFAISLSSNHAVLTNSVVLIPKEFSLEAYWRVASQPNFWQGYLNTIIYTVSGTIFALVMTMACAYPLSKKELPGRGIILKFIVFTMYFGGGMIPNYLLIVKMDWIDSIAAIIVPGAISVYNMLVMRTFFAGIPASLEEAAMIDGMGHIKILMRIVIPLSKPVIATISLFYAVGYWNDWFAALIYLTSEQKMPVTLFLRNLLMGSQLAAQSGQVDVSGSQVISQTLQAAAVILIIAPILCVYPFIQKYFVQGVMIGSIKE